MSKKILLVASVQSHIAQFHKPLIALLKNMGATVHIAARNNLAEKNGLKIDGADEIFDVPFARSPISRKNLKAYKILKNIIKNGNYDVIHCNTPVASILTRKAANKARKNGTKVIYTAHGFHFYKGASRKSWLLWYNIEKHYAKKTDILITINREDYETAKQNFKTDVKYIHGVGVNENRFLNFSPEKVAQIKEEFALDNYKVILCTGELNDNKNQKTVISAMPQVLAKLPNVKLLIAGNCRNEGALKDQINALGLNNNVFLLGYRSDLENYVNAADLVVSASLREGLGLNVIEGMICGKPAVVSDNRGHRELVVNGENGFRVNALSDKEFAERIIGIFSSESLYKKFSEKTVQMAKPFTIEPVTKELKNIYEELLDK